MLIPFFSNQFQPIAESAVGPDFDMILGMAASTYPHTPNLPNALTNIYQTSEKLLRSDKLW